MINFSPDSKESFAVKIRSRLTARVFLIAAAFVVTLVMADSASAQEATGGADTRTLVELTRFLGAGLVVIGAAMGIGRLAASAYESMARQPEVAGTIQTAMIIAAALIEGFTFYALFICQSGK